MSAGSPVGDLTRALALEEDKLLACVHCGFCLPACPTYNRLGNEADSPRGRLHLMRAVVEGRLEPESDGFALHLDQCLGCRMCEPVCPAGVRYGFLLERARAVIAEASGVPASVRAMLGVFRRPRLMRFALGAARLARDSGAAAVLLRLLPAAFGRARFALAMLVGSAPAREAPTARGNPGGSASTRSASSRSRDARSRDARSGDAPSGDAPSGDAPPTGVPSTAPGGPAVTLLAGCVQSVLYRRVNRATDAVLRARGCTLSDAPGQGCCGALHAHAGLLDHAKAMARHNVRAFSRSNPELIAVNAAGCGAFMKEYGELLHDEPSIAADAARVAARTRDVSEIVMRELAPRATRTAPLRVAYDEACHLHHGQGVHIEPYRLLESIDGIELVPLANAAECCGGAGIYGLTHPDLGGRILRDKIEAIRSAAPDVVATANPGCAMQIAAGLRLAGDPTPVVHPMELLAVAENAP